MLFRLRFTTQYSCDTKQATSSQKNDFLEPVVNQYRRLRNYRFFVSRAGGGPSRAQRTRTTRQKICELYNGIEIKMNRLLEFQ